MPLGHGNYGKSQRRNYLEKKESQDWSIESLVYSGLYQCILQEATLNNFKYMYVINYAVKLDRRSCII